MTYHEDVAAHRSCKILARTAYPVMELGSEMPVIAPDHKKMRRMEQEMQVLARPGLRSMVRKEAVKAGGRQMADHRMRRSVADAGRF